MRLCMWRPKGGLRALTKGGRAQRRHVTRQQEVVGLQTQELVLFKNMHAGPGSKDCQPPEL